MSELQEMAGRYRDLKSALDEGYRNLKELEMELVHAMKEGNVFTGLPIKWTIDEYRLDAWLKDREREQKADELKVKK